MEHRIYKGEFWLVQSPDHKLVGELEVINDNKILLNLEDVIDTSVTRTEYINEPIKMEHELIIGNLFNNECVALIKSHFYRISRQDNILLSYIFDIVLFTKELRLDSLEDLEFDNIMFSFPNLHKYIGTCVTNLDIDDNHVSLTYQTIKDSLDLEDNIKLNLTYGYSLSLPWMETTQIRPTTMISLDLKNKFHVQDLLTLIDTRIGVLFSFVIGIYMCPIEIKLIFKHKKKKYLFNCFYRYFIKDEEEIAPKKYLFLRNIMSDLKLLLVKFYIFQNKYSLITDNYIVLYKYKSIIEYEFLTATYSLETFSRYVWDEHFFYDDDSFKTKYKKQMDFIASEFTDKENTDFIMKLQNNAKYSNEISFRAIVKKILKKYEDIFIGIFEYDQNTLSNEITNNRNWYTHYSPELEKCAIHGIELYQLFVKVRVLFEVCLFKHLEMKDDMIINTIKTTYMIN